MENQDSSTTDYSRPHLRNRNFVTPARQRSLSRNRQTFVQQQVNPPVYQGQTQFVAAAPPIPYISPYVAPSPQPQPLKLGTTAQLVVFLSVLVLYLQSPWPMGHYVLIRRAGTYIAHSSLNAVHRVHQIMILEERVRGLEAKLFQYSRDGVARQDFAFRYAGAQIVEGLTTPTPPEFNTPYIALDDDLRVGRCWRIPQTSGQIGILLSQPTKITHLSIDHIPRELVVHLMHAPRDIILWGVANASTFLFAQTDTDPIWDTLPHRKPAILQQGLVVVPLAVVTYDIASPHFIQTFNISHSIFSTRVFSAVIFDVVNNWGEDYTCLYRVRIHGEVPS